MPRLMRRPSSRDARLVKSERAKDDQDRIERQGDPGEHDHTQQNACAGDQRLMTAFELHDHGGNFVLSSPRNDREACVPDGRLERESRSRRPPGSPPAWAPEAQTDRRPRGQAEREVSGYRPIFRQLRTHHAGAARCTALSPAETRSAQDRREVEWRLAATDLAPVHRWLSGHPTVDR